MIIKYLTASWWCRHYTIRRYHLDLTKQTDKVLPLEKISMYQISMYQQATSYVSPTHLMSSFSFAQQPCQYGAALLKWFIYLEAEALAACSDLYSTLFLCPLSYLFSPLNTSHKKRKCQKTHPAVMVDLLVCKKQTKSLRRLLKWIQIKWIQLG